MKKGFVAESDFLNIVCMFGSDPMDERFNVAHRVLILTNFQIGMYLKEEQW